MEPVSGPLIGQRGRHFQLVQGCSISELLVAIVAEVETGRAVNAMASNTATRRIVRAISRPIGQ